MSIYIFYINEPGKEVYDNNNNNNDNDDNNDDDVNSNSLFSCCHSDWAGLFSSLQISQTCCLNTAIVLIQLLSVCLLLSPFFPSSLAVWAVMLFSTCQNTKLSLRSAFFILWLRHRRSEELCDRRDADKLVHCFEGPFFFLCSLARGKKHYEGEMKPPSSGFMQFAISSFWISHDSGVGKQQ